jgi:RNA polymerase sigma factor (sigma-70 family)
MKHEEKMKIITDYLIKQKRKQDIISDVYIKLSKSNLEKYNTKESLIGLTIISLKNMQFDYYRKNKNEKQIIDEDISNLQFIGFLEENDTITLEEYYNALTIAKNKLNDKQKQILELIIENKKISNKEIGEIMNESENSIKTLRKRMYDKIIGKKQKQYYIKKK